MGAIAVDVNDIVGVNAAAFRVLSDNLGDDATRVFINQFKHSSVREAAARARPRVTATQIADIMEQARAKAEARRGKGDGDYTKEKYELPEITFEEAVAEMMAAEKWESAQRAVMT